MLPTARTTLVVACLSGALGLGGCMEGTELNGKLFDLMGVSSAAQSQAKVEPKMAQRSGLVMPPNTARLPEPGSEDVPQSVASLQDPEKVKAAAAAERARLHKLYCNGDLSWKQRIVDPDAPYTSPYGSCTALGNQ